MKLKAFVKDLESVAKEFQSLYEKTDEGFVLSVDGEDYKNKIGEFRGNNIELKKQLEKYQADLKKFDGIDIEKAREAQEKIRVLEEKKLLEEGDVEKILEQRTERMRQDHAGQIKSLTERAEKAEGHFSAASSRLTRIEVDNTITKALSDVAVPRKGAMLDILGRASGIWTVEDGKVVAKNSDGEVIYGKEGKAPLTPQEWASQLQTEAPFLFEPNSGAGGKGSERQSQNNGSKIINKEDRQAFSANIAEIAKGKVDVR